MKLAIMQPYFLPYIGYWQLLSAVDEFVLYDNIQYAKKGWINRNRFLRNGTDVLFTIPLKKDSDYLDVRQRSLATDFRREELLNQLVGSYRKAPCFREVFPLLEKIVASEEDNLFRYIAHSIRSVAEFLSITTPVVISSNIEIDHGLAGQNKVIALCKAVGADVYINAIGGQGLYTPADFAAEGIDLKFLRTRPISYPQFDNPFVPNLSILDVMMFNDKASIRAMLCEYDTI